MMMAAGVAGLAGAIAIGVGVSAMSSTGPESADIVAEPARIPAGNAAVPCLPTTEDLDYRELRDGIDKVMVPEAPYVAIICRYDGIRSEEATPLPLTRSGRIEGEELSRLVDALNISPAATPRRCPPDFGAASVVVVTFVYQEGPSVNVRWGTGPCDFAANGAKSVEAPVELSLPPYWN